jgi:hypothetical protein
MNYTLIILGVILCVIIYMMFKFITEQGKVVTNIVTLNSSTSNPVVQYSALSSPASSRYYLSFWINVKSLTEFTEIFSINTSGAPLLTVSLSATSELKYKIKEKTVTPLTDHSILTNFPLQKWVYVILSFDGQTVDIYIDGKLIRSEKLANAPEATTKETSNITFKDRPQTAEIYLAKFERNPTVIDPSTAWSNYMAGNGGNYFSNLFSSYGATFTLTKDNLDVNKLSLF